MWLHTTLEGPWPHYMILEASRDGLWTLSFGLSQSHGHGSWLVCEVALKGHNLGHHSYFYFIFDDLEPPADWDT